MSTASTLPRPPPPASAPPAAPRALDRTAQTDPALERGPARDVQLLDHLDKLETIVGAGASDTLGLLRWRHKPLALALPNRDTRTTPTARRKEEALVVREGEPAPDFTLTSDSGETVTLSSLRGKPVVLYFYPKDDSTCK